jgi:iron complex transport system substrate-binding protein
MRVASLLPSATELLCCLEGDQGGKGGVDGGVDGWGKSGECCVGQGADGSGLMHNSGRAMLVGRSHECDFPPGVEGVPVLTAQRVSPDLPPSEVDRLVREQLSAGASLYTLDLDRLVALRPDLILTQDLCAVCSIDLPAVRAAVDRLTTPEFRPEILSLNPQTVEDVLDDLLRIGRAVGLERAATRQVVALRERLFTAADFVPAFAPRPVVAFLEWTDPLFIGGHWTPQLIERAGGDHPLNPTVPIENAGAAAGPMQAERRAGKSVRIPPEALVAIQPEYLVICPCGIKLDDVHRMTEALAEQPWWDRLPAVRAARAGKPRIAMVDGNQMFNRPGPRLVDAYEWLVGWLNDRPELILPEFPWRPWPT